MKIVIMLNVLILILSVVLTRAQDLDKYILDQVDDPTSFVKQRNFHDAHDINVFNESPEIYSSYDFDWPILNYLKKTKMPFRGTNQYFLHTLHRPQFVPEIVPTTERVPHLKLPSFDLPNILPFSELVQLYRQHYMPEVDTLHPTETLPQREFPSFVNKKPSYWEHEPRHYSHPIGVSTNPVLPHVINTFNNWSNPSMVDESNHSLQNANHPRWNPYSKYGNDHKSFNNYGHVVISNRIPVNMDVKTNSKSNLHPQEKIMVQNGLPHHELNHFSNYYRPWSPFDLMHK
ncbi:uncharacterized protein LOC123293667 [Chrysoperla carnea]|uniref:uncharacterized protein LOC123293667 n=1 Tax=Chrysoperla carnea TaxID=189513 RepID=UPI001D08F0B1|nr:uncharacterized protein LOC123293667 [Chrysoperla carnea]XP_044730487.1 uncharacterized protein LOC123293667 [Chrysoperla carnea]